MRTGTRFSQVWERKHVSGNFPEGALGSPATILLFPILNPGAHSSRGSSGRSRLSTARSESIR